MPEFPLPRTVEQVTVEWLNLALQESNPDTLVHDFSIDHIIWGTATKILIDVRYEKDGLVPRKLCIKGEFDEKLRGMLEGVEITGTQVEAEFYAGMAPGLGLPLLKHWYAASESGMGILILDNLTVTDVVFGTPTEPWSADLVARGLDVLAMLHGCTWRQRYPEFQWLQVGSPAVQQAERFLMSEKHWSEHFSHPGVFQLPEALRDRVRNLRGFEAMWEYDKAHADYLIHGDAHIGNTCIGVDGQPFFIDWAGPCYSNWAADVSYFIAGALTVADRRHHEESLVSGYLQQLAINGGPSLSWEQAWIEYRIHHLHGMAWPVLPPTMQSTENVQIMGERHTVAVIDHDSLQLLGV